jgi:hypothetical protein
MQVDNHRDALKGLALQAAGVTAKISHLAATSLVMQKFIDLTLPMLTSGQSAGISIQLRQVLEDVMALMGDVTLPAEYHAAFLARTNEILSALEQTKELDT